MSEKQTCNFHINGQSNSMSLDLWWISVSNCKCSVTTSENHCTQTTSPAIDFHCNWTTSVWCKANYDISLAWKRQQNLWLLQTAAWKVLKWIAFWNEHWTCTGRTDCEIFRHHFWISEFNFTYRYIYTLNHKKRDILFLTITLANLNRFS